MISLVAAFPSIPPDEILELPNDTVEAMLSALALQRNRSVLNQLESVHAARPSLSIQLLTARNKAIITGDYSKVDSALQAIEESVSPSDAPTNWTDTKLTRSGITAGVPASKKGS